MLQIDGRGQGYLHRSSEISSPAAPLSKPLMRRKTSCKDLMVHGQEKGRLDSQLADNSVLPLFWRESCRDGSVFLSLLLIESASQVTLEPLSN
jgi:hypothetical protein